MKLKKIFFLQKDLIKLSKDLLGKVFVFNNLCGLIYECELYTQNDKASHSYLGKKTKKNEVMFYDGGHLYVYFTYGKYFCCNIVVDKKNIGNAILIRGIIPIKGIEEMIKNRGGNKKNICDGPGKFCMAFNITKKNNGWDLCGKNSKIYLEDLGYKPIKIIEKKRVGISKAKNSKLRFIGKF